ncbi:MAG: choline kinase, partial [Myxococcota bacterium]
MLDYVREVTNAKGAKRGERLQALWSGYGEIVRVHLEAAGYDTVIVKHVAPPNIASHPRGWANERGHARKLRSYEVEAAFYERYAERCPEDTRVAKPFGVRKDAAEWLFVLEDLDGSGYERRARDVSDGELLACLEWLAGFHAAFMHESAEDLWSEGTYWHLATRPDELASMDPSPL